MKKLILLSLITLLCLPVAVYAASMGGVETQGQGKFAIGMDQEFGFDRDYKDVVTDEGYTEDFTIFVPGPEGDVEIPVEGIVSDYKVKINLDNMSRSLVKLSYGVLDHLDIFATLGEANFKSKFKGERTYGFTFGVPDEDGSGTYAGILEDTGTFKGKSAFAWGLGAKGVIPFENGWFLGMQAQYLTHKNTVKISGTEKESGTLTGIDLNGDPISETFGSDEETITATGKATVQEWQIAPYVAKKLGNFIPYFGVKYSDQRMNYKDEDGKLKIKAADNFGLFLGTDYKIGKNFSLNIEGRFIDETAMSLGATYRF